MPDPDKNAPAQIKENLQFPFSEEDWVNTPASVQEFLVYLVSSHAALEKRIEEFEKRLKKIRQLKQAAFFRQCFREKAEEREKE